MDSIKSWIALRLSGDGGGESQKRIQSIKFSLFSYKNALTQKERKKSHKKIYVHLIFTTRSFSFRMQGHHKAVMTTNHPDKAVSDPSWTLLSEILIKKKMTYSCACKRLTLFSHLSFESDLKELMKSYQQSLMMWHRRQFVDERWRWRRRRSWYRVDGISQFHACLMNWQHWKEENFLLNLSALNHLWHREHFHHLVGGFPLMRRCLPKLYSRKLIINEFLPRGLTNFIFECLCVYTPLHVE